MDASVRALCPSCAFLTAVGRFSMYNSRRIILQSLLPAAYGYVSRSTPQSERRPNPQEVERLVRDFEKHTLVGLEEHFCQLVYLASLRDYNTGRYRHYGLEARYAAQAINEGLHQCHVRVFEELVALPLKEQTEDLLNFFESLKEDKARLVGVWRRLRSYRILPLEDCYPLARELVRTLGTILESEHYPIKDRFEQSDHSRAIQRGEPDSVCEVQTL